MANKALYISSDDANDDSTDLPEVATSSTKSTARAKKGPGGSTDKSTKKKSNAAIQKEAFKQKLAEEKAAKKSFKNKDNIYKPGECIKYMNVEAHPLLWSLWWCADVSREVAAMGARVMSSLHVCDHALILWSRRIPPILDSDNGQVRLAPTVESCNHSLFLATAEEVAEMVINGTLTSRVQAMLFMSNCKITVIVFGYNDYFSPRRKTTNSNRTSVSEIQLNMALAEIQLKTHCDTIIANTPNELALLIAHLTKAVAEAPYRLAKYASDEEANFYMRGESKKCVAVDREGIAIGRLWQQMVAVLPNSSLEISRALCAQYKSPLALFEAFQLPNTEQELADIGVSRAAAPGSKARRIGPELARKLKILFTADDGNMLVD